MRFTQLEHWLAWMEHQHTKAIDPGLERIGEVAAKVGLLDLGCPVITVGGTNGKGSTVATLVSIYRAAGLTVGSYTSPHLVRFNERICLNGEPVSDELIMGALDKIDTLRGGVSLSYFEFATLAGFLICKEAGSDVIVLEVGMGGRLDAVNLIDADVAVVTSIGLDHMEWLGDSVELIAIEKAGIFRAGKPAICGDREPPDTLIEAAEGRGTPLLRKGADYDFVQMGDGWSFRDPRGVLAGLPLPSLALENAATALAALRQCPVPVSEAALREGLASVRLAGRAERAGNHPEIVLDVGHNPHGAQFFMQQVPPPVEGQRTFAVFAMLADKDIGGVIDACLGRVDAWHIASLEGPRGASWARLQGLLLERGAVVASHSETVAAALRRARQAAGPNDRILVFGSFYTVGAAKEALATYERHDG